MNNTKQPLKCLISFIPIVMIVIVALGFYRGFFFSLDYILLSSLLLIMSIILFSNRHQNTIQIVAFIITFILVVIGISLLAKFLTKMANLASLGIVNKVTGGVFGLLKTILILSISLNLFQKINDYFDFELEIITSNSLIFKS